MIQPEERLISANRPFLRIERPATNLRVSGNVLYRIITDRVRHVGVRISVARTLGLISGRETIDMLEKTDVLDRMTIDGLGETVIERCQYNADPRMDLRVLRAKLQPHETIQHLQELVLELGDGKLAFGERDEYSRVLEDITGMGITEDPKHPFSPHITLATIEGETSQADNAYILKNVAKMTPMVVMLGGAEYHAPEGLTS